MTTASITHHPIPIASAVAAVVAVLAFGVVVATQNDDGTTTTATHPVQVEMPNLAANYHRPMHSGVQIGLP